MNPVQQLRRVDEGSTYACETDLTVMVCPWAGCSITYAIPERLRADSQRAGNRLISWYCPNGHSVTYPGLSEEEQLKRDLERERTRAGRLASERDQARASARAQRAAATRARNQRDKERKRVGNGVCPCCNRSFANLQRHMTTKHPEHAHPSTENPAAT